MKYKDLHRYLMMCGYLIVRENKHRIYSNGHYSIAVPFAKDIAIGTLRDIFKVLYPNDIGYANRMLRQALGKES